MKPDFSKYGDELMPAIVQDNTTGKVLMLGFMNNDAFEQTQKAKLVTFFSRAKNRLWTKGETSGNHLHVEEILIDCDLDTILIKAKPAGPVCHTGADTCFNETNNRFNISMLESVIAQRMESGDDSSYTRKLFQSGINKIAQKVGEEAVELVIESKDNDRQKFLSEAADLLFHYLVLLRAKGYSMQDVLAELESRHK